MAGGPTEYSNLNNVKITRGLIGSTNLIQTSKTGDDTSDKTIPFQKFNKQVIKVNLKKLLDKAKYNETLPMLQPGDVVRIGRNTWFAWQAIIRVVSQVAIVAQVWWYWSRTN